MSNDATEARDSRNLGQGRVSARPPPHGRRSKRRLLRRELPVKFVSFFLLYDRQFMEHFFAAGIFIELLNLRSAAEHDSGSLH